MKGWQILACIILGLWLIGMIRAQLIVIYDGNLTLRIKVAGIPRTLYPKKLKRPDPEDFTPEKYRKLLAKEARKQAKKTQKAAKKAAKKKAKQEKARASAKPKDRAQASQPAQKEGVSNWKQFMRPIIAALKSPLSSFGKHLEIEAVKLHITVGGEDAAKTAILYGMVSQGVAYGLELLSQFTNLRIKEKNRTQIRTDVDFNSDKLSVDLHLILKLRVWHFFAMGFALLWNLLKNMIASKDGQSSEESSSQAPARKSEESGASNAPVGQSCKESIN